MLLWAETNPYFARLPTKESGGPRMGITSQRKTKGEFPIHFPLINFCKYNNLIKFCRFTWNTSINEPYDNEIDLTKEVGERKAKPTYSHTLTILNVELTDSGNYSCHFPSENENITETSFFVQSVMLPKIVSSSAELIKIKNETVVLFCVVEAYPMNIFKHSIAWEKETVDTVDNKDSTDASQINAVISNHTKIVQLNETRVNVTISFKDVNKKHNGTYKCSISQPSFLEEDIGKVQVKSSILVLGVPLAMISYVKAVGATKIFMNWTINDGNDPIDLFYIQFQKENQSTFSYYFDRISGKNTSYVLEKFEPNTKYQLKLQAQNSQVNIRLFLLLRIDNKLNFCRVLDQLRLLIG